MRFLLLGIFLLFLGSNICQNNYHCGLEEFCLNERCTKSFMLGNKCLKTECEQMKSCEEAMWYLNYCEIGEKNEQGETELPCSNVCIWFE